MTSHKEQPAVDTSAEKLREQAKRGAELAVGLETTERERFHWLNADMAAWMGTSQHVHMDNMRALINDVNTLLRFLAAHPAEPAGMELETTAEERDKRTDSFPDTYVHRLTRDFDRMRACAEKAEAALKQPVNDEEVEALAQVLDLRADFFHRSVYLGGMTVSDELDIEEKALRPAVSMLRRLVRERDALSIQLRDAQARGKGMEEALKKIASHPEQDRKVKKGRVTESYGIGWAFHNIQSIARAALSRPEGSAT